MKTRLLLTHTSLGLLIFLGGVSQLRAEIVVRLSVKFILKPDGTRPSGGAGGNIDISTTAGFDTEIARGNQVLADTGRGYRLQVTYEDVQPPVPGGEASDYWFNLDARGNRQTIEDAALADTARWKWNWDTLNIYINNSSSGQCSLVGNGFSISLGGTIFTAGTVVHEVGHFFDLRHTHAAADSNGMVGDWGNGDGLTETLDDDPDASAADIDARYPLETQQKRDDLYFNVMSYHVETRLLPAQMDIWSRNANGGRLFVGSGRTWFVAVEGNDGNSGADANSPLATFSEALSKLISPEGSRDDVILLRAGTYTTPLFNAVISTPCTLSATRGAAVLTRP